MPALPEDVTVVALAVSLVWLIVLFGVYRHMSGEAAVSKAKLPELNVKFNANLSQIRAHDLEFRQTEFLDFVAQSFKTIHQAIAEQNESLIVDVMEPHLFHEYHAMIEAQRTAKRQIIEKRLRIHGSAIRSAVTVASTDCITVRLLFSSAVYEVDNTGEKMGDKKVRAWEEDWTFRRHYAIPPEQSAPWRVSNIELVEKDRFGLQRSTSGSSLSRTDAVISV